MTQHTSSCPACGHEVVKVGNPPPFGYPFFCPRCEAKFYPSDEALPVGELQFIWHKHSVLEKKHVLSGPWWDPAKKVKPPRHGELMLTRDKLPEDFEDKPTEEQRTILEREVRRWLSEGRAG